MSYLAVDHAHSVCFQGQPQKKGISPCIPKIEIKDVKGVFCANQCLFAPHVPNVPNVAPSLAVGGRLQKFWQVWLTLGRIQGWSRFGERDIRYPSKSDLL